MTSGPVGRITWLVVACAAAVSCNGGLRGPLLDAERSDASIITARVGTADAEDSHGDGRLEETGPDVAEAPDASAVDAPEDTIPTDTASEDDGRLEETGRDVAEAPDASAVDALEDTIPTDTASEVAPPPPSCDVTHPFGTPYLLGGIAGDEGGARFTADELTMYSFSVTPGVGGIFVSTRSTKTSPFGLRRQISSAGPDVPEAWPSPTPDQLMLFLEVDGPTGGALFFTKRSTVDADFSTVSSIGNLDASCFNGQPYTLPDQSFYFVSTCDGSPDLYMGTFDAQTGRLTGTAKIPGLNTDHLEYLPTPPADGLSIYFASDRAVPEGSLDIWMATRSSTADPFGPPSSVVEVNTLGNNEVPIWASPDNCRLYFRREREGNGSQLFVAERAP